MNWLQNIKFEAVKHSPELLLGVGIAGAIITVVAACKATMKVNEVLEEHKENLEKIDNTLADERYAEEYTEKDAQLDKIKTYRDTTIKMVKLYAPAVIIGVLSIGCMVKSNDILNKRNISLAAAYTLMDNAYTQYRKNVVDRFGEEVDQQLQTGTHEVEVTEMNEKGKTKTEKILVANDESGYVKYFTEENPDWDDNEDFVTMFLRAQQNAANAMLRKKGWLTLNEVYKFLNFKETKAGMVVGWKYESNNKLGDNFIQFTVKEVKIPGEDLTFKKAYAIDFNVDGEIFNRL